MITSFHSNYGTKLTLSQLHEPCILGTPYSNDSTIIKTLDLQNLLKKNMMTGQQLSSASELNQVLQVPK